MKNKNSGRFCLKHVLFKGHFRARANPSVGFAPFIQSMACNVKNTCYNMSSYKEIPDYKDAK